MYDERTHGMVLDIALIGPCEIKPICHRYPTWIGYCILQKAGRRLSAHLRRIPELGTLVAYCSRRAAVARPTRESAPGASHISRPAPRLAHRSGGSRTFGPLVAYCTTRARGTSRPSAHRPTVSDMAWALSTHGARGSSAADCSALAAHGAADRCEHGAR